MTSAVDLQTDVMAILTGDARLVGLLGDQSVYDTPPRDGPWPRVVLATIETADWSTATEPGAEHRVTLHAWSRGSDRRLVILIAEAIRAALGGATTVRTAYRIVTLEHQGTRIAPRGPDTWQATIRFRITTEPL